MTAPDVIRVLATPATGVAATSYVYRRRAEDTVRYVEQVLGEMIYGQLTCDGRVAPLSDLDRLSALRSASEELSEACEHLELARALEDAAEGER